jgi:dihydropteridine reductase
MSAARNVLILGGSGALGRDVVSTFAAKGWRPYSIDLKENKDAKLGNTLIKSGLTIPQMQSIVMKDLKSAGHKFGAVINVAGGWAGGDVASEETAANTQLMLEQSVYSSIVAAHAAAHYSAPNGLLVLTGSKAALGPTHFMVGYGLAKAAVHQLVRSIATDPKAFPEGGCVVGVLPITLDTPGNRAGMPDADYSTWTKTTDAAKDLLQWAEDAKSRPTSGSLVVWETKDGKTIQSIVPESKL